jgi:chromate transporter
MGAARAPGGLDPLIAGTLAAVLTTWVTFVPCFLWIFLGAPFVERLRGNGALSSAMTATTAAVVGVVLNLALWFALHTLFQDVTEFRSGPLRFDIPVPETLSLPALALTTASLIAVLRFKSGPLAVIAASAAAGMLLWALGI